MTRKYETIFIINPELSEEETKALVEKIKGTIEASAQLESIDEWGKRKLAYPIDHLMRGIMFWRISLPIPIFHASSKEFSE